MSFCEHGVSLEVMCLLCDRNSKPYTQEPHDPVHCVNAYARLLRENREASTRGRRQGLALVAILVLWVVWTAFCLLLRFVSSG